MNTLTQQLEINELNRRFRKTDENSNNHLSKMKEDDGILGPYTFAQTHQLSMIIKLYNGKIQP